MAKSPYIGVTSRVALSDNSFSPASMCPQNHSQCYYYANHGTIIYNDCECRNSSQHATKVSEIAKKMYIYQRAIFVLTYILLYNYVYGVENITETILILSSVQFQRFPKTKISNIKIPVCNVLSTQFKFFTTFWGLWSPSHAAPWPWYRVYVLS